MGKKLLPPYGGSNRKKMRHLRSQKTHTTDNKNHPLDAFYYSYKCFIHQKRYCHQHHERRKNKENRKITILLNLDSQDIGAITHSNPLHS